MKICLIDRKNYGLYEPFLNDETRLLGIRENQVALGFASIIAMEDDDGVLEFSWMDADEMNGIDRMNMIFFVIVNAIDSYGADTEVIICPYMSEVEEILGRFGFTEDEDSHETRIYTYYI